MVENMEIQQDNKDSSMYMKRVKLMQGQDNKNPLHVEVNKKNYIAEIQALDYYDPNWCECKIIGSNIQNRSYPSLVLYQDEIFIYGGYQIDIGILEDFWSISLNKQEYVWLQVKQENTELAPGKRCRHTAVCYKNQMIIFGGQYKSSINDNKIFKFDLEKRQWNKVHTASWSVIPEAMDSHNSIITEEGLMIVLCGYYSQNGEYTNQVYQYNIEKNDWKILFESSDEKKFPKGRAGASAVLVQERFVYVFGGGNQIERMNDLWKFDLQKNTWEPIDIKGGKKPMIRSGQSLINFQNKLVLFGGIHDITCELDDVFCFNMEHHKWTQISEDTISHKANLGYSPTLQQNENSQEIGRESQMKLRNSQENNRRNSPSNKYGGARFNKQEDENESNLKSPTKTIQEQKQKLKKIKKAEMLKQFEIEEEQLPQDNSPTSQAMANSLISIGNPRPQIKPKPGKITDFGKQTISKFNLPLTNNCNTRNGKKPCARDGHQALVFNDKMIIFGGDRHNMSFNNLFLYDLIKGLENF